jgi:hypothetical protein
VDSDIIISNDCLPAGFDAVGLILTWIEQRDALFPDNPFLFLTADGIVPHLSLFLECSFAIACPTGGTGSIRSALAGPPCTPRPACPSTTYADEVAGAPTSSTPTSLDTPRSFSPSTLTVLRLFDHAFNRLPHQPSSRPHPLVPFSCLYLSRALPTKIRTVRDKRGSTV